MLSKGTQTKENIVEKSLQLFSVKGYYNTSINDILEATQLTKGGLYGHFKSKDEIWQAAYDRAVEIQKSYFKDRKKKSVLEEKSTVQRLTDT
ncbi:MAG: TetR/AcrR family transcriptional regulator [Desulfotignum sp.]|nr:TetR/AcrR family transcriptional regulator [Desulfotignum sp.]